MLAGGDEDLGAGDLVGAVGSGHGAGLDQAQVGTAVRLGETHGAGPHTLDQLGEVGGLLLLGAMMTQRVGSTVRQAGVHAPRQVGGADHLGKHHGQRVRQPLAAMGGVCRQARPAAFDVLPVGLLEALRRLDLAALEQAALLVAALVQRQQHLAGEAGALFENGGHHVRRRVFTTRQAGIVSGIVQHFVHHETKVAQGGLIIGHFYSPERSPKRVA